MTGSIANVYLHIGQTKTGSSFLQSALAMAVGELEGEGIAYPIPEAIAEEARAGKITSGNFWPREGALEALIEEGRATGLPALLISSEAIFDLIAKPQTDFLQTLRALCPDARVKVLCYLRDPVDHAISVFQQQVKRGGFTGSLAESLKRYAVPVQTVRALTRLDECGAGTTVFNYSRHKRALPATMESFLGLPAGTLPQPRVARINRSLTNAELELQRAFNRHFGPQARRFVSDPLCNSLPDIPSETPPLSPEALAAFLTRMQKEMGTEAYRVLVPAAERPFIGTPEEHAGRFPAESADLQHTFTASQIDALVEALSGELKKVDALRTQLKRDRARFSKALAKQ